MLDFLRSQIARRACETHLGRMVKQPCRRDPLLVATRQRVRPVPLRIPPSLTLDDVPEFDDLEAGEQIRVRDASWWQRRYGREDEVRAKTPKEGSSGD